MSRAAFGLLCCALLSGLSCAVTPTSPSPSPGAERGTDPVALEGDALGPQHRGVATARAVLRSHRTGLTGTEIDALARVIVSESRRRDLDPELVLAVIAVESGYDNFALSPAGAMGLMQLMPRTGEELADRAGIAWRGPHMLFDPIANVRLGIAYLKELSLRYGHLSTALAAYNWGPGRIDRRLRRGTPVPKRYPRLVLDAYGEATREDS